MIDFDAKRINDLFKDGSMEELKEGITLKDVNSVGTLTPLSRTDLQSVLQKAYTLIYENATNKINEMEKNKNIYTLQTSPSIVQQAQLPVQLPVQAPQKEVADALASKEVKDMTNQLMALYNNVKEESTKELPVTISEPIQIQKEVSPIMQASTQDTKEKQAFDNLIKEKDSMIVKLLKEKEEALNKQQELENHVISLEKDKNEKDKNTTVPNDTLVDYLKETIQRLEQKQALMNQELGKLKGMLGM